MRRFTSGAAAVVLAGCNQIFGLTQGAGGDAAVLDADDGPSVDAPWRFGPWGNAATVLADPAINEDDAILSADGQELIYAVSSAAAPVKDFMVAARDNGTWNTGVPLTALNSSVTDGTARFGAGDLAIYFGSDRPGSQGGTDVWRAERAAAGGAWRGAPERIDELVTTSNETDPWVSADGRHLLFSRDAAGASDVWEAFRDPI